MPSDRAVHLLIFDGYADWEPANALAELRRYGRRDVRTVGFTREAVVSMGGLRVVPDMALADVDATDVELLIIPGGDMWERGSYPRVELEALVGKLVEASTPVAAICAGTLALGRARVLDDRRHTSNAKQYLSKKAPEYRGGDHYVDEPAVRDGHVITASGLAPVDFAREIFAEMNVLDDANRALWFRMFKSGRIEGAKA